MGLARPHTSTLPAATRRTPDADAAPSKGARVVLLGDSLAEGLSAPLAALAAKSRVTFVAHGSKGTTIRYWLSGSRAATALAGGPTTLVLVSLGTNDMYASDAAAEGQGAGDLIDALRRAGAASVAWIGPPRLPVEKNAFRSALASECSQRAVRIFDSQALDLARAPDHVHMTPAGYRAWAESIAAWVPFASLGADDAPQDPEPVTSAVRLRERLFVAGLGELLLDDYVARVVTGEVGGFQQMETLKAQAIAARSFVQRALRDDPTLGTADKPVQNGETFQVAARVAKELPARAARETRGGVMLYQGRLILSNYVAGAPWAEGASAGVWSAQHWTEKFVTYNDGLDGAAVIPTTLANPKHRDNRGCMSQNGAQALAIRGWKWPRILRFFYGDDIEFTIAEPADPDAPPRVSQPEPIAASDFALPLFTAAALAYRIFG